MSSWTIRAETPRDVAAIRAVTEAAFTDHPHSEGAEPAIVDALREDGDLALSLVAIDNIGEIVGHAAWSAARLSTGEEGWLALGPISVLPDRQRQGVGSALIRAGVARLAERGAKGVILLGDPDYYGRFGFLRRAELTLSGPLGAYLQVLPFADYIPQAQVGFAPAFTSRRIRE